MIDNKKWYSVCIWSTVKKKVQKYRFNLSLFRDES